MISSEGNNTGSRYEAQTKYSKKPIKLTFGVIITLCVRTTIIQIFHRFRAKQIMHQLVFNIKRHRLVEMPINNNILPRGRSIRL